MSLSFFSAASFVIAVPSAVAVFAWIATIWTGRPQFTTPFLFFAGFILLFVIGGLSGFMTASVALDWQLTDTYFIVAHLHYVLLGINVFPVIGGLHFWFPKVSGRMRDERLGRWTFWTMFVGFNAAFFPMHITGLIGMPRRVYSYPAAMGVGGLNLISTVGAFVFAIGILLFLVNVVKSLNGGALTGNNPSDAPTLEWATTPPPPVYNFATIPQVSSRYPLWEDRLDESAERSVFGDGAHEGMLMDKGKETIGVSPVDAVPNVVLKMPGDSLLPFLLSIGMMALFLGMLAKSGTLIAAGVLVEIAILAVWLTPQPQAREEKSKSMSDATRSEVLPVGGEGSVSTAWWGMLCLIATEGILFVYLIFSYAYLGSQQVGRWPPSGPPSLTLAAPNTAILVASSGLLGLGLRAFKRGAGRIWLALALAGTIALGTVFITIQGFEWAAKPFSFTTDAYSSAFFILTGIHMAHVAVGLLMLVLVLIWTLQGRFDTGPHEHLPLTGLYWHFVDVVWIAVFVTAYVLPQFA